MLLDLDSNIHQLDTDDTESLQDLISLRLDTEHIHFDQHLVVCQLRKAYKRLHFLKYSLADTNYNLTDLSLLLSHLHTYCN
jgi:hypothetical protein